MAENNPELKTLKSELPNTSDEELERLIIFKNTFKSFFAKKKKGTFSENWRVLVEMRWFYNQIANNSIRAINKPKAKKELNKLEHSLKFLASFQFEYRDEILKKYFDDADPQPLKENSLNIRPRDLWEFIHRISKQDELRGHTSEIHIPTSQLIGQVVRDARQIIDDLPDKKRTNWEAVNAVSVLRLLWKRNTSKKPPKYLNPTSKFADFLETGFEHMGVKGNTSAAFRRWSKINTEITEE